MTSKTCVAPVCLRLDGTEAENPRPVPLAAVSVLPYSTKYSNHRIFVEMAPTEGSPTNAASEIGLPLIATQQSSSAVAARFLLSETSHPPAAQYDQHSHRICLLKSLDCAVLSGFTSARSLMSHALQQLTAAGIVM